ncbi:MAG: hypothetical protein P1U85_10850 [Verrucomicrobiales bacterium]|nr:hypothetical protein [Verrucomicrobiales bacterium]
MTRDIRFFFFQYEKEVRTFFVTVFVLGAFTLGKARFDQWQMNRFQNWATVSATILDAEVIERMSNRKTNPAILYRAQLKIEYPFQDQWFRSDVLVTAVPPSRLQMMERGREIEVRIPPKGEPTPVFRWTDQKITPPTD